MKCLVLGGGGYLGSHLCDALLAKGYSIRIFGRIKSCRFREFSVEEDVEWIEGDFRNEVDVAHAVPGCDIIFHLISTTLPKSSNDNPVYDVETNLVGTLNLLNHAHNEKVKKVIFISSGGTVYGIPENIPIKESHPCNPLCSYGISKLSIEKYLHLYYTLYGLDYCILRLANPFGERQRVTGAQGAVTVFLDKALKGETIDIWGDGSVVRDYIYVHDAVNAMIRAIDYDGSERLFNVGSGKGYSLNEMLDEIESLLGRPVARNYTQGRSLDVPVNILDIELARCCLKWQPKTTFRQGLESTLEWMQKGIAVRS